jgi:hypothetical protein
MPAPPRSGWARGVGPPILRFARSMTRQAPGRSAAPERRDIFSPVLQPDETIVWRGRPDPRRIFSRSDLYLIPLTILLAILCVPNLSTTSLGLGIFAPLILVLYLIAILIALYLLVGRFVYKRETRACTYYAVSDRGVLTANTLWGVRIRSQPFADLATPRLDMRGRTGTISFVRGRDSSSWGEGTGLPSLGVWRSSRVSAFHDVADATEAFEIIRAHQATAATATS